MMSLGERAVLHITSDYGYGERGAGGDIPPNADLDFDVRLVLIHATYCSILPHVCVHSQPVCVHTYHRNVSRVPTGVHQRQAALLL